MHLSISFIFGHLVSKSSLNSIAVLSPKRISMPVLFGPLNAYFSQYGLDKSLQAFPVFATSRAFPVIISF